MYRVEDKYLLSEQALFVLEKRIAAVMEPDMFSVEDNGYTISSIYFDDLFDTHLIDTVDGVDSREKYRIRIYNNNKDIIKLEIKTKLHNRISKASTNISPNELDDLIAGRRIAENDEVRARFNAQISMMGLRPKVIVSYERKAYVSEAGNVRITFDRNVRASNQYELFGTDKIVSDLVSVSGEPVSLVEVKYDELLPSYIADVLEMGNMWQTSYSKYRLCRENERI